MRRQHSQNEIRLAFHVRVHVVGELCSQTLLKGGVFRRGGRVQPQVVPQTEVVDQRIAAGEAGVKIPSASPVVVLRTVPLVLERVPASVSAGFVSPDPAKTASGDAATTCTHLPVIPLSPW